MILFKDAATYYEQELHQQLAWEWLQKNVDEETINEFAIKYRTPIEIESRNPLLVPYQSQNDNASGEGYRECFSSSMAMIAMYYGKVANDDEYNKVRQRYGDSTSADAQIAALVSLGLKPTFITNASKQFLTNEIDSGRPLGVAWLHHGSVSNPTGGGHWTVATGYTVGTVIQNDPNGEASLVTGGYTDNMNGAEMHYSWENWLPRWCVENNNSGWCMKVTN